MWLQHHTTKNGNSSQWQHQSFAEFRTGMIMKRPRNIFLFISSCIRRWRLQWSIHYLLSPRKKTAAFVLLLLPPTTSRLHHSRAVSHAVSSVFPLTCCCCHAGRLRPRARKFRRRRLALLGRERARVLAPSSELGLCGRIDLLYPLFHTITAYVSGCRQVHCVLHAARASYNN